MCDVIMENVKQNNPRYDQNIKKLQNIKEKQ